MFDFDFDFDNVRWGIWGKMWDARPRCILVQNRIVCLPLLFFKTIKKFNAALPAWLAGARRGIVTLLDIYAREENMLWGDKEGVHVCMLQPLFSLILSI